MKKLVAATKARIAVILAIASVASFLAGYTHRHGDFTEAWIKLRVPAVSPEFRDTITVTYSIDCLQNHLDPYIDRSLDPYHRVYNYPPIWLDLRYLGITSRSTIWLGSLFAMLTAGCLLILFRAQRPVSSAIIFLTVISPPVLLAVERGNIDQVVLALLVFGYFLIDRFAERKQAFTSLLIVFLTVLKVFPVAAIACLLKNRKSILLTVLVGFVSVTALLLTSGHQLFEALANTPQITWASFGTYPLFTLLGLHLGQTARVALQNHHAIASFGAVVLGALSLVLGTTYRARLDSFLPRLNFDTARGRLAISSLALFCFIFAAGSSFNYRLLFLLPALAYLIDELERERSWRALPACAVLLLFFWRRKPLSPYGELLDGLVFMMACAWLGTNLLDRLWLRHPQQHSESPSASFPAAA